MSGDAIYYSVGYVIDKEDEGDPNLRTLVHCTDILYIEVDENNQPVKYLTKHGSEEEYISRELFLKLTKMLGNSIKELTVFPDSKYGSLIKMFDRMGLTQQKWNQIRRLSYNECFSLKSSRLRTAVFAGVNIKELVEACGYEKIDVSGVELTQGDGTVHSVYELLKVDIAKLLPEEDRREDAFSHVVRCWCTSTKEEHYLWVKDEFTDSALQAIASTCVIQKELLEHCTAIKRQGDTFYFQYPNKDLVEKLYDDKAEKVHLTPEQYTSLLIEQS